MRQGQRPGVSNLAQIGGTVVVGLCLLGLAPASAWAAEGSTAAELSPLSAREAEPPETVKPDPPPQATGQSPRSSGESTRTAPTSRPPVGGSPPPHPLLQQTAPESPELSRTSTLTHPRSQRPGSPRRAHPGGRERAGTRAARAKPLSRDHARSSVRGATALSPATSHRQGVLLLFASLASALLMLASLALLRLLKRLGAVLYGGPMT